MSETNIAPRHRIPRRGSPWLRPGLWLVLIANLAPLAGVLWWQWDAFLLLTLYWMETIIVAFWTIVRIAFANEIEPGPHVMDRPFGRAAFFAVHSGIFIVVHFIFLWSLFSGGWPSLTGNVTGFFVRAIAGEGLWAPLLMMFLAHGISMLGALLWPRRNRGAAPGAKAMLDTVIGGLYRRILVMQIAIIFGAWLAIALGSIGPLLLLIAAKTLIELYWDGGPLARPRNQAAGT